MRSQSRSRPAGPSLLVFFAWLVLLFGAVVLFAELVFRGVIL